MSYIFNINSSAAVVLTNRLEKLRKSALPNAIRNTLNGAAFDVKQRTMPSSAGKHFINRKQNFFRANSKVFMAQGFSMTAMKAVVAFVPYNAEYNNFAVRELEQQEHSGTIHHRTFVPLNFSRSGQSLAGQVLPSNRLKAVRRLVDASKYKGRNKKEQFIKAAVYAGKKGFVIGNLGKKTVFRINTIKRDKDGKTIIGKTPLYSFSQGRSVRIKKATHFMREASFQSAGKITKIYHAEAMRQINRVFK